MQPEQEINQERRLLEERRLLVLDSYSKVAGEASDRTRAVGLVLIFASVITLISVLNSMQSDYFFKEYYSLHDAWNSTASRRNAALESQHITLQMEEAKDAIVLPEGNGKDFLSARHIRTYRDYINYDEVYRGVLKEAYLVRIPILGIAFHVNDLGLVSAITFFILMIVFYSSLVSELTNLNVLFHKARVVDEEIGKECLLYRPYLRYYFKVQAAKQVLTITPDSFFRREPREGDEPESKRVIRLRKINKIFRLGKIPPVLFGLPSFACLFVFVHDLFTLDYVGFSVFFNIKLILTIIFCALLVVVNRACILLYKEGDSIWDKYYDNFVYIAREQQRSDLESAAAQKII